jgi:hypothetical protein
MRSGSVGTAVIVCVLWGSAPAFAAPATGGLPVPGDGPVVRIQAQATSQRTAKRRRPARRPAAAASSTGANPPPAGSQGFDPKKIWESD